MVRAQIIRHPQGRWVAMAAVPVGSSVYTFSEEFDERPVRKAADEHVSAFFGPKLRSDGVIPTPRASVAGAPVPLAPANADDTFKNVLVQARRVSDSIVNPIVRQELLGKLNAKIASAAGFTKQLYQKSQIEPSATGFTPVVAVAASIGGTTPNDLIHVAVGQMICAIAGGSQNAIVELLKQAKLVPSDESSTRFMQELIQHAIGTPVLQALHQIFLKNGFQKLAQVVLLAAQGSHQPQRAGG